MYAVSQITPLEWRKAPVCNHGDDDDDEAAEASNDHEFHLCKNSSNSFDGHEEHFTSVDGAGNCSENYSTLERYFKNASEISEDAWLNIEHRRNFLEQQQHYNRRRDERKNFDETLDIDDDGLIGFEDAARHGSLPSTCANEEHEEHNNNIELIAYVNNFNLRTSFWWAMGTLIQTTSDLQPKVSLTHSLLTVSRVNLITEM